MQQTIDSIEIHNYSFLLGFLRQKFPMKTIQDLYMDWPDTPMPDNAIVHLDDEMFVHSAVKRLSGLLGANSICIFQIQKFYDDACAAKIPAVLFPFWHPLDDAVSINRLRHQISMAPPTGKELAFCCFNRNIKPGRQFIVDYLIEKDLIGCGWVTHAGMNSPGLRASDLDHYYTAVPNIGFERHGRLWQKQPISTNGLNYVHINRHHTQPVNISVESYQTPFMPSEKSLLAFFVKKVPIIIAPPGRIALLRDQGFDMFDDIVDHGYDNIEDWQQRIKHCVDSNLEILRRPITVDQSLQERLDRNWNYLIFDWLYAKLQELQDSISDKLDWT